MTATTSAQDALTAVHEAAQLGGDTGRTLASIAAAVGLTDRDTARHLMAGAARGILSRIDGRWVAWPICPTCGRGIDDQDAYDLDARIHPGPGVCRANPADRCAGYPLATN